MTKPLKLKKGDVLVLKKVTWLTHDKAPPGVPGTVMYPVGALFEVERQMPGSYKDVITDKVIYMYKLKGLAGFRFLYDDKWELATENLNDAVDDGYILEV